MFGIDVAIKIVTIPGGDVKRKAKKEAHCMKVWINNTFTIGAHVYVNIVYVIFPL